MKSVTQFVFGFALATVLLLNTAWTRVSIGRSDTRDIQIAPSDCAEGTYLAKSLYAAWDELPPYSDHEEGDRRAPNKVLTNVIQPKELPSQDDVVMVTHTSGSRIKNLLIQLQRWNGPAAISVYIKSRSAIQEFLEELAPKLMTLAHVPEVHVVMENTTLPYPFNLVRNVAMHNLQSDYFVAMDADFITNPNAHQEMLALIRSNEELRLLLRKKSMFVLPAYERTKREISRNRVAPELWLPQTKRDLVRMSREGKVDGFHLEVSAGGHKDTDYDQWEQGGSKPYFPLTAYINSYFEPYVLGYRHGVPPYWNGLRGYGFDKVSWFNELRSQGFQFYTLMDFYIVHIDHPSTRDLSQLPLNKPQFERFQQYDRDRYESHLKKPSRKP